MGLIRDAEIENTIRTFVTPLFNAAGLDPDAVKVYIIDENALNSFVTGGQNIFITTGLLMRADSAGQVIGVIAHETGHIEHGDLARTAGELSGLQNEALAAQIIGILLAIGTGNAGAAAAAAAGGAQLAERSFLQYSRGQETAADQAAVKLLDATHQSSKGLLNFFKILENETLLAGAHLDPYLQTHPLTPERISFVSNWVEHSPYSNVPERPEFQRRFAMMRAKLIGFIQPLGQVLRAYPEKDQSLPARYARAIAYYRAGQLPAALPLTERLIAEQPDNPYFHEVKGQMLFENGKLAEARTEYEEMVRLAPHEPLLRTELAHVLIESGDQANNSAALANLNAALQVDNTNAQTWQLAATAYGRNGQLGMSALSNAEYNLLIGRKGDARGQANRAARLLPRGSPGWLRAQDIENTVRDAGGDGRDRRGGFQIQAQ
jgi:predicted Zn-dependent protease